MKQCKYCGQSKPLSEYHKNKNYADGHKAHCKDCNRAYSIKWRNENIEYARAKDRERGNRQDPDYVKAYRKSNPIKYGAHKLLNNRLRSGEIVKPKCCEVCGSDAKLHGHHDDYSKPLDVRWLCPACHKKWHKENGEGKNAW